MKVTHGDPLRRIVVVAWGISSQKEQASLMRPLSSERPKRHPHLPRLQCPWHDGRGDVVCRQVILMTALLCLASGSGHAIGQSTTPTHRHYSAHMPPGAIGRQQLSSGSIEPGYVQPVQIHAPAGALIAPVETGTAQNPQPAPVAFGLRVGHAYRFQLSDIPLMEGVELYPTVEIIDRLHPPEGRKNQHPIPIDLSIDDIKLAAAGNFVTRVVYVEDPLTAIPVSASHLDDIQPYFDVPGSDDPLHVADNLGRAVAIVRIGSRSLSTELPEPELDLRSPPAEPIYDGPVALGHGPVPTHRQAAVMQSVPNVRRLPPPVPFQGPSHDLIQRARR